MMMSLCFPWFTSSWTSGFSWGVWSDGDVWNNTIQLAAKKKTDLEDFPTSLMTAQIKGMNCGMHSHSAKSATNQLKTTECKNISTKRMGTPIYTTMNLTWIDEFLWSYYQLKKIKKKSRIHVQVIQISIEVPSDVILALHGSDYRIWSIFLC